MQMFPKVQLTAFLLVVLVALAAADDTSSVQSLRHSASVSSNGAASNYVKPRELKMGKVNRVLKGMGMMTPLSKTPKESKAPKGQKSKAPKGKKSKAPKEKKSKKPKNTKAPKVLR
jgi:hypothetical protein